MTIQITEESTDGQTVRLRFGYFSLSVEEAHAFAADLSHAAAHGENARDRHERHVNLVASCALCRHEAGAQTDRLDWSR